MAKVGFFSYTHLAEKEGIGPAFIIPAWCSILPSFSSLFPSDFLRSQTLFRHFGLFFPFFFSFFFFFSLSLFFSSLALHIPFFNTLLNTWCISHSHYFFPLFLFILVNDTVLKSFVYELYSFPFFFPGCFLSIHALWKAPLVYRYPHIITTLRA